MDNEGLIRRRLFQIRAAVNALEILINAQGSDPGTPQKRTETAFPAVFEEFWALYPKKVGKMAAYKAWEENVMPGHGEHIVAALRKQVGQPDWIKEKGIFVPKPENWLADHRWLDEVKKGGSNGTGKYGGFGETV